MHGYVHFSSEPLFVERQVEVVQLHREVEKKLDRRNQMRLLELVDAEARLQDDVSLANFIAGFRLACGIAHELGLERPTPSAGRRKNGSAKDKAGEIYSEKADGMEQCSMPLLSTSA